MYEILVQAVLDGELGSRDYTLLGEGLELPATDEAINEMMTGLSVTEKDRPFTACGYRFRLDALNGTIIGERRLDELNRFARYLSPLWDNERAQLSRFAGRRTRLTPLECMSETPLFIGEDMREFTVAVMPEEYHTVPSVGYLHLPAIQDEFIDALDRARAANTEYYIEVRECRRQFLRDVLPSEPELFELNHLAERLAELDENESLFFEAMVKMEKKHPDVARLINLTYNLNDCVIAQASNLKELGKFAVDGSFFPEFDTLPENLLGALDYTALGRRFQEEQGGVFIGGCFIANIAGDEMRTPYNGDPSPFSLWPKHEHVLLLFLECSLKDGCAVYLDLPASDYEMARAAKQLGWDNLLDRNFISCRSSIPKLNEALTGSVSIYELSDFAEYLQMLRDDGDLPKYKDAMEITDCAALSDYVALAENLDKYEYYPEMICEYDYGEWELLGEYRLDSTCTGMEHFDFSAFGRERMKQNGVVSTPYGMIRKIGPEQELTQQDAQHNGPDAGIKFS